MGLNLAVLPGDGVGPAATTQELNVSRMAGERFGHSLNFNGGLIDGVSTDSLGKALSYETAYTIGGYAETGLERRVMPSVGRPNLRGE